MDQLLERDANAPEMIAEMSSGGLDSTLDDTHHDSQMLTQDESQIEAQQMSQDEEVCYFFLNLVYNAFKVKFISRIKTEINLKYRASLTSFLV